MQHWLREFPGYISQILRRGMTVRGKASEQAKETLSFQTMRTTETQFCSWSSLKVKTGSKIKAKAGAFWGCLTVLGIKPRVLYTLGSDSPLSCTPGQTLHLSVLITFNLFTWGGGRYVYHGTCMEMRRTGSSLILCGSWGWNSGPQALGKHLRLLGHLAGPSMLRF